MENTRLRRNKLLAALFFLIFVTAVVIRLMAVNRYFEENRYHYGVYTSIHMQYQGSWDFEVRTPLKASPNPDLSEPLLLYAVQHPEQRSYSYECHIHEPMDALYVALPEVYEIVAPSVPIQIPLEEGRKVTLPDGRDWFVIQSVEYDAARQDTVSITLLPLLEAIAPPMTLAAGEHRRTITPKENILTALPAGSWDTYCFETPAAWRTADGQLPPDTQLILGQARVLAKDEDLSLSSLGHTLHVVE